MVVNIQEKDLKFIPIPKHKLFKNLTHEIFNYFYVLGYAGQDKNGNAKWYCRCICGTINIVLRNSLTTNDSKSCGCEVIHVGSTKHNECTRKHMSPEYRILRGMRSRCSNSKLKSYKHYGGRGIKLCERWEDKENGFFNFINDMGRQPSPKHSIDRVDNNGDYTPENCRWATTKEQARNRRSNRLITFNGESKCLQDWATQFNLSFNQLRGRLNSGNYSLNQIFSKKLPSKINISFAGEIDSMHSWSKRLGIDYHKLWRGIHKSNKTIEEIFMM